MHIFSWNVNGLRAVERKGVLQDFIQTYVPDIILFQETKLQKDQTEPFLKKYPDYDQFYHQAEKKGYSGTSTWVRKGRSPHFETGMMDFEDTEGRIIRTDIKDFSIFNIYFPNGGKSPEAWKGKLIFYETFLQHINTLREQNRKVIWAGDVNAAHQEIDLARPKDNENSIGFLPQERAWIDKVIDHKWSDIFRERYPQKIIYSWWHVITRARERNVGWRIDYFFIDQALREKVKDIVYLNEQMGSDHCPLKLEINL